MKRTNNRINLTESHLHRVITESVRKVIKEDRGIDPSIISDVTMGVLEDNVYSFMDEGVSEDDVIKAMVKAFNSGIMNHPIDFWLGDLQVRIQNRNNGFVSVSNEEGTGVSEPYCGYPIDFRRMDEDNLDYEIENLLNSIEEAYYALMND